MKNGEMDNRAAHDDSTVLRTNTETSKQTNMRERILTGVGEEVWREAHLFPSPSKGRKEKRRAEPRKSEKKQDHQDE